jgi:hypothetical protein
MPSTPRLSLKMVEESSVRRFAEAVGVGKVYGPYGPYASDLAVRPYFMWVALDVDARLAAERLYPFLSSWRREKMSAMLPLHVKTA